MATYEITAEMNLKKIIAESREVAQALNEFADNLERIETKYAEPQESSDKCKNCKYYLNPDYTRCHECKAERNEDETAN